MVECHIFGSHENPMNYPTTQPWPCRIPGHWRVREEERRHLHSRNRTFRRPWGPWGFLMVSWKGQHGFQELVQPFGWFEATQNLGNLQSGPLESGWYGFSMIFSLFWKTRFSVCFGKWTLGKWMVWIFSLFWKTRLKPSVGSWTRFLRRDITTTRFLRCTCSLDLPQDSEAS